MQLKTWGKPTSKGEEGGLRPATTPEDVGQLAMNL